MEEKDSKKDSMKDLWDSFRLQINERLSSPLIGSFTVSWLIWNHRLMAVLFSGMSVEDRFEYIDKTLYPTAWFAWGHHFVGPLACALAYVFIYPYPSKFVQGFWLRRQNEAKKQRDEIDGAKLLTREEMDHEKRLIYGRAREAEEESRKLRDELESTKISLREALSARPPSPNEAELQKILNSLSNSPPPISATPSPEDNLSKDAKELLLEISKDPNNRLRYLPVARGLVFETQGRRFIEDDNPRSRARWEGARKELVNLQFLEASGQYHDLTRDGFAAIDRLKALSEQKKEPSDTWL